MNKAPTKSRLADLLLIVALCGLIMGAYQWFVRLNPQSSIFLPMLGFMFAFMVWRAAWRRVRGMRTAPFCPDCGRRFLPGRNTAHVALCHECRQRSVDPTTAAKTRARGRRAMVVLLVIYGIAVGFLVPLSYRESYSSSRFWVMFLLVSVGAAAALVAFAVGVAVIFALARLMLLRNERYILWSARNSADREGSVRHLGAVTIWWSGPDDPVPMIQEQIEVARDQVEKLMGQKVDLGHPLRILCFGKRSAFVCYHRRTIPNLWNLDGFYIPSRVPAITFTTDQVAYKLNVSPRLVCSLFVFHFLKMNKGFVPPFWLLQGIGSSLTNCGQVDRLEILNRKMKLALAGRSAPEADLFRLKPRAVIRLVRNWYDHRSFAAFSELYARAWSVVEFLGGQQSPPGWRERFSAFLGELPAKGSREAAFQRHFDFGFDGLNERWQKWVLEHGAGSYGPPPPEIRQGLSSRIIPTIADRNARIMDRIQAIREIGLVGYVMGADTLIELLRTSDMVLSPEIVWSLQAVSGQGFGHDVDRWQTWIESVPAAALGGE
jgi:hypothetical protein